MQECNIQYYDRKLLSCISAVFYMTERTMKQPSFADPEKATGPGFDSTPAGSKRSAARTAFGERWGHGIKMQERFVKNSK
jgi:hypothetical protein